MPKLNQILAIDTQLRARVTAELSRLHHDTQKPALVTGLYKKYEPNNVDGETYPDETQKVQCIAEDVLDVAAKTMIGLFDVTACKDWTNCSARADLEVGGKSLLKGVPVTYLLFLEKQLVYLQTFVAKMVELDPGSDWQLDEASGLYKTQPTRAQRTRKVQKVLVKIEPTDKHPGQAELITVDEVAGTWIKTLFSGAIEPKRKKQILDRIDLLANAVKYAREEANSIEAVDVQVGRSLFDYLLAE